MNKLKSYIDKNQTIKKVLYPLIKIRQSLLKKNYLLGREIINNLGDILVGDPIISVDDFQGAFAVDVHSDLFFRIVLDKNYEPELIKLCLKYIDKERDIIDIGANIGFFTVLFAKNSTKGKVFSIEPTKNALKRLHQNIKMNNVIDNVDIFEGVISNSKGTVNIKTIKGKEEYSSLGNMNHPSISNEEWITEEVKSVTLDELVHQKSINPGFIKIDVEGVEHLVFKGAHKVLKESRPIILSELSDFLLKKNGSSANEVITLIESYDYEVHNPINPSIKPGTKNFGDILCFPKELDEKFII